MDLKMKRTNNGAIWIASVVGTTVSIMISFLLTVLIAVMVNKETIEEDNLSMYPYIIWFISVATGTLLAQKKAASMKLFAVGATAMCYIIVLSVIVMILPDGNIGSIGKGTVVALIGAIPSLFAILKKSKKENIKFKI